MKQIILVIFSLGFLTTGYCQYDFLFERKTLEELRIYEKSINSESLGYIKTQVAKDYFPTAKEKHDYYPMSYVRTNDPFYPYLHIQYFYSENDSTLLATSYDWNIMDYVKNLITDGDKFEIEKKRKKEYLQKYNSIKSELINKFGQPDNIEETKSADGYFYRLVWKNETTEILVLLKFSKIIKSLGEMKFASYNIRVKIDYIK